MIVIIVVGILNLLLLILFFRLVILAISALKKYTKSTNTSEEKKLRPSLGEKLKQERLHHKMTQEYLAEKIGVSRQAVSKWENGVSEPSTSNLMAIAKLYQLDFEKLLKEVHID